MLFLELDRLIKFEISQKQFYLCLVFGISLYLIFSFTEIFSPECTGHMRCFDYDRRERLLYLWNFQDNFIDDFTIRHSFSLLFLAISRDLFGFAKIAPLISSVLFLVLTALLSKQITKSRFFGMVSFVLMIIDPIFLKYDTSMT